MQLSTQSALILSPSLSFGTLIHLCNHGHRGGDGLQAPGWLACPSPDPRPPPPSALTGPRPELCHHQCLLSAPQVRRQRRILCFLAPFAHQAATMLHTHTPPFSGFPLLGTKPELPTFFPWIKPLLLSAAKSPPPLTPHLWFATPVSCQPPSARGAFHMLLWYKCFINANF